MTQFEIYQFVLCFITFALMTGLFSVLLIHLYKSNNRLIEAGLNDEKIKKEYLDKQAKRTSVISKIIDKVVLGICCAVIFSAFAFSLIVTVNEGKVIKGVPSISVVKSESMSYVNEKNKYVKADQDLLSIDMFDVVFISALPKEEDLKVNDIVIYETDGYLVIHRIVGIEEPNQSHSERYFILHGDANEVPDKFPVRYNQMKGIYTGKRIPLVGSFVLFLQSPAGYLCIILVLFAIIVTPIMEKKIEYKKIERLVAMGEISKAKQTKFNFGLLKKRKVKTFYKRLKSSKKAKVRA